MPLAFPDGPECDDASLAWSLRFTDREVRGVLAGVALVLPPRRGVSRGGLSGFDWTDSSTRRPPILPEHITHLLHSTLMISLVSS